MPVYHRALSGRLEQAVVKLCFVTYAILSDFSFFFCNLPTVVCRHKAIEWRTTGDSLLFHTLNF